MTATIVTTNGSFGVQMLLEDNDTKNNHIKRNFLSMSSKSLVLHVSREMQQ